MPQLDIVFYLTFLVTAACITFGFLINFGSVWFLYIVVVLSLMTLLGYEATQELGLYFSLHRRFIGGEG